MWAPSGSMGQETDGKEKEEDPDQGCMRLPGNEDTGWQKRQPVSFIQDPGIR